MDESASDIHAGRRHKAPGLYQRVADDFYVEPRSAVESLFDLVPFAGTLLDPAAGSGTIVEVASARGFAIEASDLVQRRPGIPGDLDFLDPDYPYDDIDCVVTNPPFRLAEAFAARALGIARFRVALLVPLPFLASQRRHPLFAANPTSHVVILSRRPSMPPGDQGIAARGGKEDYAWVVWTHGHIGPPQALWAPP